MDISAVSDWMAVCSRMARVTLHRLDCDAEDLDIEVRLCSQVCGERSVKSYWAAGFLQAAAFG